MPSDRGHELRANDRRFLTLMESLVSDNKLLDKSCWWRYGKGPFYWEVLTWIDSTLTAYVCFGLKCTWLNVLWFKTKWTLGRFWVVSNISEGCFLSPFGFLQWWLAGSKNFFLTSASNVFSWFLSLGLCLGTFLVQNLGCGQPCCGGKKCFISTSIVYKKCTVICANDVRSEDIKQVKWNGCPCYRCTDQNMFCPHPIPFPLVIWLPSSSLEPDVSMLV